MALTLHYHPLSSYCHKVLIALDELGLEAELRMVNLGDPAARAAYAELWPTAKIPLLVDAGRVVPETSIQIEHLQLHHARDGRRLIPDDREAALDVRLWDRLFDLHVMTPMNVHTSNLLCPAERRDPVAVEEATGKLQMAYALIDRQLEGRTWITGEVFTLADCAAAPSLFYAIAYVPPAAGLQRLTGYFDRLMARPSVARAVDQARPWFQYFPGRAGLQRRFYDPASA